MKMNYISYKPLLLFLMLQAATACLAQNIGFRTLAPHPITVTRQGNIDLEFDCLVLDSDMVSTIAINDIKRVVALAIDAPAHYDLKIYIAHANDDKLLRNGSESEHWIPFSLEFAYANTGYPVTESYIKALLDAVKVPKGHNPIIFPVSKRATRLPPQPSTPVSGRCKQSAIKERAFLFIYGSLGSTNAGHNVVAGTYENTIEITIDYINHEK